MALTDKQKAFCLAYARCADPAAACYEAGYKPKTKRTADVMACRLLQKPEIQERLAEIAERIESDKIADAAEVMRYWTSVLRGESRSVSLSNGNLITKPPSELERLEASKQLAKRMGLDKPDDSVAKEMLDKLDKVIGGIDALAND